MNRPELLLKPPELLQKRLELLLNRPELLQKPLESWLSALLWQHKAVEGEFLRSQTTFVGEYL